MNGVSFEWGNLSWYYDTLPTNCVGDWVCAGGTGCGFDNLAVFCHASTNALKNQGDRILRICWETNGSMSKHVLGDLVDSALNTGGCIKFDLKAWDETLHIVLTGVTNRQTLENFTRIAERIAERSMPPLLIASTLMVPRYIGATEVERIAAFIKRLDPNIPYGLLAFHPQHEMRTSRRLAVNRPRTV